MPSCGLLALLSLASCHPPAAGHACNPAGCVDAIEVEGETIPGVYDELACAVDTPSAPASLEDTLADWCAGTTSSGSSYATSSLDLSTCTDAKGAEYRRADRSESCCTDLERAYQYVWTDDGVLVYSREWIPDFVSHWCCCGEATVELIYGVDPGLTCAPADRGELCP